MRRGGGRHEKADFKYLKPLIQYLGKNKVPLLIAILFSILGTIFTIIGPTFVSKISDLIRQGVTGEVDVIDISAISKTGIMLIAFYVTAWILSYFQAYLMNIVTQKTSFGLRNDISTKINVLPLKFFDSNLIGDILSRVVNDVDSIANTMHQSVANLFHSATQFIGCMILMFSINWVLTLVALASAVIGFILMIILTRFSQKYFSAMQRELGQLNGHDEEIYAGHNVVKAYNAEEHEGKRFNEINARFKFVN
ncbi:MAG: ABC transporter ATP-binding protein, partial [Lachnospiraceae bacterium]|nr:ABC transporter ATP-binding protein [Lachnospiraceae bacterium]